MSAKIKFNIFNTLFHLFSFLADKTNGWGVFVRPKLLFGSLVMGLGISAYSAERGQNNVSAKCDTPVVPVSSETITTPEESTEIKDQAYCYFVEVMPSFPGGEKAMFDFINKELSLYYKSGMPEGKVICKFIIEEDGTISNVEVLRGVDPVLDKEAVRIIESMPRWIPAKRPVMYTLPIRFKR